MLQYFVKWKGYPKSDSTWEPAQNIHAPDLLKKYHQHYPLQDKKGNGMKKKTSSQAQTTTTCLPTLPMNLPPVLPTNCLSLLPPTTTQSHLLRNSLSMSRGKFSRKQPPITRRNCSPLHHTWDSTSSAT